MFDQFYSPFLTDSIFFTFFRKGVAFFFFFVDGVRTLLLLVLRFLFDNDGPKPNFFNTALLRLIFAIK